MFLDVVTALAEARAAGTSPFAQDPAVVGGRYGLSSKEFTPAMVKAVFYEIARPQPRRRFTVGIVDDVTHLSLDWDRELDIEPDDVKRGVFFGLGADGTVGANKNSIKIIGEENAPPADLRGAGLPAPTPCGQLSSVAAAEPDRDPDPLSRLRAAAPGPGHAGADLAAAGGPLPPGRAPRDARRDIAASATTDAGLRPHNMPAARRETRAGRFGPCGHGVSGTYRARAARREQTANPDGTRRSQPVAPCRSGIRDAIGHAVTAWYTGGNRKEVPYVTGRHPS